MDINFETLSDIHRTVSAAFRGALRGVESPKWSRIATQMRSAGSSNLYPFLGDTDGMREWVGDAVFDQLKSHRYSIENRKFQKGLTGELDEIMDDLDSGVALYSDRARILAGSCVSHPDALVFADTLANGETLLCHDGQPFFDDSHPNANDDGGTQDNLIAGGGTPWYLFDTTKVVKPLIYQLRVPLRFDAITALSQTEVMKSHKLLWTAWMRDAAGFGVWWTGIKSYATLDETNFKAARDQMRNFHIGQKDPLSGAYRSAGANANLLVIPQSLQTTAEDLFLERLLATGEANRMFGKIEVLVSEHL